MKKITPILSVLTLSLILQGNILSYGETKREAKDYIRTENQTSVVTNRLLDGKFPGLSADFKILDKDNNKRQGSMIVVVVKDGKIDSMRTRYLKGTQLKKDDYPQYLKEYEQSIIEKGLESVGELKEHPEEGKIVRDLVKDALQRSQGYDQEFRLRDDKMKQMKDGVYLGKHHGFYPGEEFLVKVEIKDNAIEKVEILNKADDNYIREEKYFGKGEFEKSFQGRKDVQVDVVTGATFSSKGIQKAVESALQQAQGYTDNRFPGFSPDYINEEKSPTKEGMRDFERKGTFCLVRIKEGKIDSVSVRTVDGQLIDRKNVTEETKYIVELQDQIKEKGIENVISIEGHEKESEQIIMAVVDALIRSANFEQEFQWDRDLAKPLKDGSYEGSFQGFYPMEKFVVKVDVKNGIIDQVKIIQDADDNYIRIDKDEKRDTAKRLSAMIESLKNRKDAQIDTVSGATFSSKGIQKAVEEALKKAQ